MSFFDWFKREEPKECIKFHKTLSYKDGYRFVQELVASVERGETEYVFTDENGKQTKCTLVR